MKHIFGEIDEDGSPSDSLYEWHETQKLFNWVREYLLNESQLSVVPPGFTKSLRHIDF